MILQEGKSPTSSGVAALMDCAASELNRLRVGAAVLRKPPSGNNHHPHPSPSPKSSTPDSPKPPPVLLDPQAASEKRKEKTTSTTGTLTSLLHIQLAQLNRVSDAVRLEVSSFFPYHEP